MNQMQSKQIPITESDASVYCLICTHTVPAAVLTRGRSTWVKPGQKCARCSASIDSSRVISLSRAA